MNPLLVGGLGTPELLLILAVVVLLFGASKLPELARGSGRALRIFKAETKGLMDDDEDEAAAVKAADPIVTKGPEPMVIDSDDAHQKALRDAKALLDAEALRQQNKTS